MNGETSGGTGPWWVVLLSGLISLAGLWLNARGSWISARATTEERRDERLSAEHAQAQASLESRQAAWTDRQEEALERALQRIDALETDRDRGWDLARAWRARAQEIRQEFDALQRLVLAPRGMRELAGHSRPPLPGLEEIERLPYLPPGPGADPAAPG